jgi:hypothetical protein
LKRKLAVAGLTTAVATIVLGAAGTTAAFADPVSNLTCYSVGFQSSPSVTIVASPPKATVNDGNPYVNHTC